MSLSHNLPLIFSTDFGFNMESQQVAVHNHAGYFWKKGETSWSLDWFPAANIYSPPVLHPGMQVSYYFLKPDHLELSGFFIGKNGVHFKNITRLSGCHYLFLIDNRIEIWGGALEIQRAFRMIRKHLDHVVSKVKKVQTGYDHLPIDHRPPRLERQTNAPAIATPHSVE